MPKLRILSLGAGVQSTTVALLAEHGVLPGLDAAIFADTQWEPQAVYDHLAWLRTQVSFPVFTATAGSLFVGILDRKNIQGGRYASIPWFIKHTDGSKGMGRRQCTHEYKLQPIMRQVRALLGVERKARIKAGTIEQWIGISTDEATRMKPARQHYFINRWPLIELGMSRQDCLQWLSDHGYPWPPKSACIGCPYHNQAAWLKMKQDAPLDFEHACQVDEALRVGDARGMKGEEYMHSARIPLRLAVLQPESADEPDHFQNECEGMCGV